MTGSTPVTGFYLKKEKKMCNIAPCRKHKKYEAKRSPRVDCLHCWTYFLSKNDVKTLSAKDINRVLLLLIQSINENGYSVRSASQAASSALYVANLSR